MAATKCKFWNFHCKGAVKQIKNDAVEMIKNDVASKQWHGQQIKMKKEMIKKKPKEALGGNEEMAAPVELKEEKAVESKQEKAVPLA